MAIILTDQELINAKRDIDDIGKAVNQKEVVHPRYGDSFKSLPMIVDEFQISSDAAESAAVSAAESANIAQSSSQIAQDSATLAELAATAANIAGKVYTTPEAGVDPVTGVADGAYFNVRSSSDESYIDEYQNVGGSAVATGKSYQSTYGFETQDKSAATIKDSSGVSQQEINRYNVFPEFFGAVGGDAEKDTKAFKDAIAAGATLTLVSNKNYHIKCDDFIIGQGKDLVLYGNSNSKITLFPGSGAAGSVFDISNANKILIDGADFTTSDGAVRRLFTLSPESYIQHFELTNNDFQNGVLLVRGTGSTTRNPESHPYGFKKFVFNKNTGKNVFGSFSVLIDYPIFFGEIRGNEFTNFKNVFFNFGMTNGSQNGAAISKITDITLDSNIWKCDDDFWANDIVGSYYTPLIVEGNRVVWTNNRVSGLKTENNVSVYDAYLSCQNVTSVGNITKNIGSFHIDNDSNAVFHGKADRLPGFDAPIKTFTDNQFVIEDSWLSKIGKSSIIHRLFNFGVTNAGIANIKNNIIKVNSLRPSQANRFERFIWHDNPVQCKDKFDDRYLQIGPAKETGCTASIVNWGINVDGVTESLRSNSNGLVSPINNPFFWDIFELKNVTLNNPLSTAGNNFALSGVRARQAFVSGIRYNCPLFCEYSEVLFNELYSEDNIYKKTRAIGAWVTRYLNVNGPSKMKEVYEGLISLSYIRAFTDKTNPPAKPRTRFSYKIKVENTDNSYEIGFTYYLNWDAAAQTYIIEFKDELGADIVATARTTESNLVYVKSEKLESVPLRIRFYNSSTESFFSVTGIPQVNCRYTFEMESF